jgi:subtilisin
VAPACSLLVGKVLGDQGNGSDVGIAEGIDWAVSQGADVISMSLGADAPSSTIQSAVQRASSAGVIVCAAAGNSGPGEGTVGYPGGFPECVCVAATGLVDNVADFSSRGPQVFIAAPGVDLVSTYPGGRYATMSGTSMATPHVAGCAALWVSVNQSIAKKDRPDAFKTALKVTALDLPPAGRDTASGYGLVRADHLVVGKSTTPPAAPSPRGFSFTDQDLTPDARKRLLAAFPGATLRLDLVVPSPAPMGR